MHRYRKFSTVNASPNFIGFGHWRFDFTVGPGDQCWYKIKVREPLSKRTTAVSGRFTHSLAMYVAWAFDNDDPERIMPLIRFFMCDIEIGGESAVEVWERVVDLKSQRNRVAA